MKNCQVQSSWKSSQDGGAEHRFRQKAEKKSKQCRQALWHSAGPAQEGTGKGQEAQAHEGREEAAGVDGAIERVRR